MSDEIATASLKTPRKPERPILWIIAGPNGSGKSSLYNRTDIEGWGGTVWIVNPDLLTATLMESEHFSQKAANLAAVQRIEAWLDRSIDVHQTVGVETVLSTGKYRKLVRRAISLGFEVRLIFVFLQDVKTQLERIAIRVSEGGHGVPKLKVKSRRVRSLRQLMWFARNVHRVYLFDNSTAEPSLVAFKESKKGSRTALALWDRLPVDLRAMLQRHQIKDGVTLVERLTA